MATPASSAIPEYITDERHFLSRSRRWLRNRREIAGFVIDILCLLISERATGRLSIDLTEGSAASAHFEQRESIGDPS
jgi:hypothetical protein